MRRGQHVRAAEGIGQPDQPGLEIGGGAAGRCRTSENPPPRTVLLLDLRESGYGGVESLFPRDLDPSGIGVALGMRALHRVEETVRRIDDLRRGIAFDANPAIG